MPSTSRSWSRCATPPRALRTKLRSCARWRTHGPGRRRPWTRRRRGCARWKDSSPRPQSAAGRQLATSSRSRAQSWSSTATSWCRRARPSSAPAAIPRYAFDACVRCTTPLRRSRDPRSSPRPSPARRAASSSGSVPGPGTATPWRSSPRRGTTSPSGRSGSRRDAPTSPRGWSEKRRRARRPSLRRRVSPLARTPTATARNRTR